MDKNKKSEMQGSPDLDSIAKDLLKERAQYEAKKDDYDGLEARLEEEFKASLNASLTEDERDVLDLDGDPIAQYDLLMSKRKAFVDDKLEDEKLELDAFGEAISQKEEQLDELRAEVAFREAHPDLDVDGFTAYLDPENGKLSPFERGELIKASDGDRVKFLGLVAEKFLKQSGVPEDAEDADIPTDISDVAGETGDVENEDGKPGNKDDAYMRSIGLR